MWGIPSIFYLFFLFQVGSRPNMGLKRTTLRLRVMCSTTWASQVPQMWGTLEMLPSFLHPPHLSQYLKCHYYILCKYVPSSFCVPLPSRKNIALRMLGHILLWPWVSSSLKHILRRICHNFLKSVIHIFISKHLVKPLPWFWLLINRLSGEYQSRPHPPPPVNSALSSPVAWRWGCYRWGAACLTRELDIPPGNRQIIVWDREW